VQYVAYERPALSKAYLFPEGDIPHTLRAIHALLFSAEVIYIQELMAASLEYRPTDVL
jgi:hypothetical protein